eukprot:CAMPEP_0183435204 /NCGR_PEP_ID=MMETSP0370-20130417/66861_1 /TAXON_ID=268820 /ORGANISM="Peridinium aciculiferum, Strain PAER-2" /LENGTH=65 /DNA_ID=CAMNT_0025622201 /DNA_START=92 /DNA_END=285 /DNA_ORIENTATION=+
MRKMPSAYTQTTSFSLPLSSVFWEPSPHMPPQRRREPERERPRSPLRPRPAPFASPSSLRILDMT